MQSATATRRDQQTEPLERIPPQDMQAERSVLGCLLLHAPAFDEVSDIVRVEDFYADKHKLVYTAICEMQAAGKTAIDIVTLSEWLTKSKTLADAGGPAYLLELLEAVPHAAHARHYAEIVRDKSRRRLAIDAAQEMLHDAYDDAVETEDLFAQAETGLAKAVDSAVTSSGPGHIGDLLADTLASLSAGKPPVEMVTTGFHSIDEVVGGFPRGGLTIVGARPSAGKTSLMVASMIRVAESGVPVLFWSFEQRRLEMTLRMVANYVSIAFHRMARGFTTPAENQQIVTMADMLGRNPIYLEDEIVDFSRVQSKIRRAVRRHKIGVIFVDYLQLIDPSDKRVAREQQVATMSRGLKQMAMSLNVAVVVASQLNRDVEKRQTKKPGLADLRESGAIEQDADLVLMLWRPNDCHPEPATNPDNFGEIVIAKNRNGGKSDVKLDWHGPTMRYSDPPSQADLVDQFEFNADGPNDYR